MQLVDEMCQKEGLFSEVSHDPVQIITMEEFEILLDLAAAGNSLLFHLRRRATNPQRRQESMANSLYESGIKRDAQRRSPLLSEAYQEWSSRVIAILKGECT